MKLIKVLTTGGKKVIINTANITYWFGISETNTNISFANENDFISVNISVDEFAQRLEACDDSRFVWDFTPYKNMQS